MIVASLAAGHHGESVRAIGKQIESSQAGGSEARGRVPRPAPAPDRRPGQAGADPGDFRAVSHARRSTADDADPDTTAPPGAGTGGRR